LDELQTCVYSDRENRYDNFSVLSEINVVDLREQVGKDSTATSDDSAFTNFQQVSFIEGEWSAHCSLIND
jgi:hypothetical protein